MSVFPITIIRESLRHRQGTKAYHLLRIMTASGPALTINRWGKTEAWGEIQIVRHDSMAQATTAYNQEKREKEGRGYSVYMMARSDNADDFEEFKKVLGPQYFSQLGVDNLRHLSPDFDTTGVREPPLETEWVKDEKTGKVRPAGIDTSKYHVPEPEPTVEDKRVKNPMWGMF